LCSTKHACNRGRCAPIEDYWTCSQPAWSFGLKACTCVRVHANVFACSCTCALRCANTLACTILCVGGHKHTHKRTYGCRYRNKALGSDYEDEVVLHAVRDDLDDPYAVLMRNAQHEAKIKEWQGMTAQEK